MKRLDAKMTEEIKKKYPENFVDPQRFEIDYSDDILFSLIEQEITLRINRGWTQADLAERMNTKQSAISRFENYGRKPSLDFLINLCNALGTKYINSLDGEYTLVIPDKYKGEIKEKADAFDLSPNEFIKYLFFSALSSFDYTKSENEYDSVPHINDLPDSKEDEFLWQTKENLLNQSQEIWDLEIAA